MREIDMQRRASRANLGPANGGGTRRGNLESAPARLRVERERRRARKKRVVAIVGVTVLVLLLASVGGAYAWMKSLESKMQAGITKDKAAVDKQLATPEPAKAYNMLLLGTDGREGEENYRTDTILVAHVDPETKHIWIISIPRDTKVTIPGHGTNKINAAYTYGGAALTIETVKNLTGMDINYYMEVDFEAFKKAVDALGGVWVDVPVAINDKQADGTPKKTASKIAAGYQLLDGDHALTFVRARHQFSDQDFSRMKNQQLFLKALADQIAQTQSITKIPGLVSGVAPYITTSMSLTDMIKAAKALMGAGSSSIYTATLTGTWKSPYIYPDMAVMQKLTDAIEAGVSFDSTATATGAGTSAAVSVKPADVSVTVRNGSGISGVAKQAASILQAQGFPIANIGNANQNVYDQTLIVYKTDKTQAELVSQYLPTGTRLVESRGMYTFTSDILVVVGKDWDVSKVPSTPVKTN
ncbi:MAG: LCP family protein [Coriobacteriia bacterium]